MIEKKITAKVDKVVKTGSLEEDQAKDLNAFDALFPEEKKQDKAKADDKSEDNIKS